MKLPVVEVSVHSRLGVYQIQLVNMLGLRPEIRLTSKCPARRRLFRVCKYDFIMT